MKSLQQSIENIREPEFAARCAQNLFLGQSYNDALISHKTKIYYPKNTDCTIENNIDDFRINSIDINRLEAPSLQLQLIIDELDSCT